MPNDLTASDQDFYLEGLYAGMKGDFNIANHLLIPQLENSIRYFFGLRGKPVEKLNREGIQNLKSLQDFLYDDEIRQIFPDDVLFSLKCLYANHAGFNLRNRVAHGMSGYVELWSSGAVYSWWIVLRILASYSPEVKKILERHDKNKK